LRPKSIRFAPTTISFTSNPRGFRCILSARSKPTNTIRRSRRAISYFASRAIRNRQRASTCTRRWAIIGVFATGVPIYNPIGTASYRDQNLWHFDAVAASKAGSSPLVAALTANSAPLADHRVRA
jgi:hypothetical protein